MPSTTINAPPRALPKCDPAKKYPTFDQDVLREYVGLNARVDVLKSSHQKDLYDTWSAIMATEDQDLDIWHVLKAHASDDIAAEQTLMDLYIRGRCQNTISSIFDQLVARDLVSKSSLIAPISFTERNDAVQELESLLCCFQGISDSRIFNVKRPQSFFHDVHWLAVVIVRGVNSATWTISDILEAIHQTGLLGKLCKGSYHGSDVAATSSGLSYAQFYISRMFSSTLAHNPDACTARVREGCPTGGFWLPCGFQSGQLLHQTFPMLSSEEENSSSS